jgi:hypothetical protein
MPTRRRSSPVDSKAARSGIAYDNVGGPPTSARDLRRSQAIRAVPRLSPLQLLQESDMGKYFLGWILGVPAVVLVGIYLVTHIL